MNTEKSESSLLPIAGFCNWKHLQERLKSHGQSTEQLRTTIALNRRLKAMERIDTELIKQAVDLEQYWKSVLQRVVSVIKFIAERGLAFRGDNELFGSPRN